MASRLLLTLFALLTVQSQMFAAEETSVTIHFDVVSVNRLEPGVTFGVKVDDTAQTDNVLTREILERSTSYQNQHIIGWGGWYTNDTTLDFATLDGLVNHMPGPTKILTLCCALPSQRIDDFDLESRPRDDAFGEFASMAATVARRYAGEVKYYQVWNELKGFWLNSPGRWDDEAYCALYNKVYDEVKLADPTALVGGPYVAMNVDETGHESAPHNPNNFTVVTGVVDGRDVDVLDHWFKCAKTPDGRLKGDFLVVDVRNFTRQGTWPVTMFDANKAFEQIAARIRQRPEAEAQTLPLWAAEWYSTSPAVLTAAESAALQMSGIRSLALGGYTRAPLWYPEGDSTGLHDKQGTGTMGLWTLEGTAATPLADDFQKFKQGFPVGSSLYRVDTTSTDRSVEVLAGESTTMLINTAAKVGTVLVNDRRFNLEPYEVLFVSTDSLRNEDPH